MPTANSVIIWTRVSGQSEAVSVNWKLATDTLLSQIVQSGIATTDSSKDYTIKIDVTGLQPDTWYYYQSEFSGESIYCKTDFQPELN